MEIPIIILFFIILMLLSLIFDRSINENELNYKKKMSLAYLMSFFLLVFAGFRDAEHFMDYENYIYYFDGSNENVELSFVLISNFVKLFFSDTLFLFVIYAILGVSLKVYAFKIINKDYIYLMLAMYLVNFYILQELTQIRVGVASAFLLLAIKPIYEKKLWQFLSLVFFAVFFHYSALILLPLYFLNGEKLSKRKWLLLIPISYLLFFLKINLTQLIQFVPVSSIQVLYETYVNSLDFWEFDGVNVFNVLILLRCFIAIFFIYFTDKLIEKNRYFIILLKIYILGIFAFVTLTDIPVLSFRISELLFIVEIALIPMFIYVFNERKISYFIPLFLGIFFLYYNFVFLELIVK